MVKRPGFKDRTTSFVIKTDRKHKTRFLMLDFCGTILGQNLVLRDRTTKLLSKSSMQFLTTEIEQIALFFLTTSGVKRVSLHREI